MRSEGKRGARKDLQGSRSPEEVLMEPGGPGGRGASRLNPQTSDCFSYSCFDLWICSCWPHRHHVSILNPLLFPPLLHFLPPPPLFSPCLPPFVHFPTTPPSRDPPAFPLLPLTAPCTFHFIPIFPFAVPRIPIEAFWAKLPPQCSYSLIFI